MFYDGYHFFGMHMLWWFFWIAFIWVIFGMYEPVRRSNRTWLQPMSRILSAGTGNGSRPSRVFDMTGLACDRQTLQLHGWAT